MTMPGTSVRIGGLRVHPPRQRASEIFNCIAWNAGMAPATRPSATASIAPMIRLLVGMKKTGSMLGTGLPPRVNNHAHAEFFCALPNELRLRVARDHQDREKHLAGSNVGPAGHGDAARLSGLRGLRPSLAAGVELIADGTSEPNSLWL